MKKKALFLASLCLSLTSLFLLSNVAQSANLYGYNPDLEVGKKNLGGYIDTYFTYSQNWDGQFNNLSAGQTDFTVDRAEIFLQHRASDTMEGYIEASVTLLNEDTEINLDEAYLQVVIPWGSGLKLTGGKFDVPIGIGANDNIDIWNWQFKMVNLLVAPWAFTGGMAEYSVGDIDFTAWVANGWGYSEAYGLSPTGHVDPDTEKTYGGRIGFSPEGFVNTGISIVTGNERRDKVSPLQSRTMVDWDFKLNRKIGALNTLDLEAWWLGVSDTLQVSSGQRSDSNAYGLVIQTNFLTKWDILSISVAYEIVKEEDGIVFGGNPLTNFVVPVESQTRQSVEVTPIFAINDHLLTDLSLRLDWSDNDVFANAAGGAESSSWTSVWEWIYSF